MGLEGIREGWVLSGRGEWGFKGFLGEFEEWNRDFGEWF